MIILYRQAAEDGKHRIHYAVYNRDWYEFSHTTSVPLATLEIDELPGNQELCRELACSVGKVDAEGDNRYYIDGSGNIIEKDSWEEAIEDGV